MRQPDKHGPSHSGLAFHNSKYRYIKVSPLFFEQSVNWLFLEIVHHLLP